MVQSPADYRAPPGGPLGPISGFVSDVGDDSCVDVCIQIREERVEPLAMLESLQELFALWGQFPFAHKCECISSVRQSGSTGSGEKAGLSDPALDGEFVVSAIASSSESFDAVRVTW